MNTSPRRRNKPRKAPAQPRSLTKGGAHKKPTKDNVDDDSDNILNLDKYTRDDSSVEIVNTATVHDVDDGDGGDDDSSYKEDNNNSEEDDDDEYDDDDMSQSSSSATSTLKKGDSDELVLLYEELNSKASTAAISNTSQSTQPSKKKTSVLGKNAPDLNKLKGFNMFCYDKKTAANYDINGEDISIVHKLKDPITPVTHEALEILIKINDMCDTCRDQIKAAGSSTINDEYIMEDVKELGLVLEENTAMAEHLERSFAVGENMRRRIESARFQAHRAMDYWGTRDAQKLVEWKRIHLKASLLLTLCDQDKEKESQRKIQMRADAAEAAKAKSRAASESKAASNAMATAHVENDPLVMTADGSMQKVSECINLPTPATAPRTQVMNKGKGKKRVYKSITPKQYELQLNGGRGGNKKKLHDHGFEHCKTTGVIRCSLCDIVFADPIKNMTRHVDTSDKHKMKYEEKLKGVSKLHQQSITMIKDGVQGSELPDEVKDYRFKALISAAKRNVPMEALAGVLLFYSFIHSFVCLFCFMYHWHSTNHLIQLFVHFINHFRYV